MYLSAKTIAQGLNKSRQTGPNRYSACCPAHDDENPSLSITQASEIVLVHCHSGCSQHDVINRLRDRGLWHKKPEQEPGAKLNLSPAEREYAHLYCLIYWDNVRKGYLPTNQEDRQFRAFSSALYEI